jgi:chorismate mutase
LLEKVHTYEQLKGKLAAISQLQREILDLLYPRGSVRRAILEVKRKRGRPRKDREADEALRMHEAGMSWRDVAERQGTKKDAARKLAVSRRKPKQP